MKTTLFAFLLFATLSSSAGDPEVNQQVAKAFKETFIYAEDVTWQKTCNGFQANFWQGAVNIKANYDKWGTLLSTTRYYFEKQLPLFIVSKVKKAYPGKTILWVTEVSSDDEVTYYLSLQDDYDLYTISTDAFGNILHIHKYKRGDKY